MQHAESTIEEGSIAGNPGSFLVDFIPWCTLPNTHHHQLSHFLFIIISSEVHSCEPPGNGIPAKGCNLATAPASHGQGTS